MPGCKFIPRPPGMLPIPVGKTTTTEEWKERRGTTVTINWDGTGGKDGNLGHTIPISSYYYGLPVL